MKEKPETIAETVSLLEQDLKIRPGFLYGLLKEDDWSFVIKGHAFVEAAVSHLLVTAIGKNELSRVVSNLELGNLRTGKLAFAEALDLLD